MQRVHEELNPYGHLIGVDADVHRVAWAYTYCGRVMKVGQFPRANRQGRINVKYEAWLGGLMHSVAEVGGVIWLEGVYLPEKRKGEATRRNVDGFRRMAEVQGEIKYAGRLRAVPVEMVLPEVWMSALLGRKRGVGNSKVMSHDWARRYWDKALTEHEADAICIGLWAWQRHVEEEHLLVKGA